MYSSGKILPNLEVKHLKKFLSYVVLQLLVDPEILVFTGSSHSFGDLYISVDSEFLSLPSNN